MLDELEEIKRGATWQNIYDCLWTIATVRYVTRQQLAEHFSDAVWQKKIATKKKLELLVQKGFLEQSPDGVLMATRKAVSLLKDFSNKNYKIIKLPTGVGQRDSIYNTEMLLQIIRLPDFYALFYPVFREKPKDDQPFLIPDGAVVFKKDNMAKLVFLEIESPKPEWQNYLEEKRWKYKVIAERDATWAEWWKDQSHKLGLYHCEKDGFGFMVWCVGQLQANWSGWIFRHEISRDMCV
ncbi:MAG: hypothetical protein WC001_05345 [Desulfurivibrionaceae bacterium]|jgi:hypothetical protein